MKFHKNVFTRLAFALIVTAMVSASGCSNKPKSDEGANTSSNSGAGADDNTMGDSDSGKAMGLQTIHFLYDSFTLGSEAKSALKTNVGILKDKQSLKIQIEGHCDARGGIQYNIALGEKRANSVKKYLQDMGISADRVTTISYGKERPLDQGTTEEAYAKNRRANFVVTSR